MTIAGVRMAVNNKTLCQRRETVVGVLLRCHRICSARKADLLRLPPRRTPD
jgi:hypothetical protein